MIRHYRHYWAILAGLLLALPMLVGIIAPNGRTASTTEARMLAPAPALPDSFSGWLSLPKRIDAYLGDHFGLRQVFLRAYALIMSRALSHAGNPLVLTGSNGWMFLRGDDMVRQSAGMIRRDGRLAEVANLLAELRDRLAVRGIPLLVASPPNSATIYLDQVPLWARNRGQRTEYDVFLDDLKTRGIPAVDLRPPLRALQSSRKLYRMHDTHWTALGAVVAFNAIVQADSHPDWKLDPASVLGPPAKIVGGDLARMLGIAAEVDETDQSFALPPGRREVFGPTDPVTVFLATSNHSGPTIMIIGDSFTQDYFPPMLLRHTGRVVWLHHQFCRFDRKWIDQFHPDEVWWMPTERYIVCQPHDRLAGAPP